MLLSSSSTAQRTFWSFSATLRNLKLYVHHQERFPRNSSSLAAPHPSPRPNGADGPHRHRQRINGLVFNGCSHETLPAYVPSGNSHVLLLPCCSSPLIQLVIVPPEVVQRWPIRGLDNRTEVCSSRNRPLESNSWRRLHLVSLLWTLIAVVTVENNSVQEVPLMKGSPPHSNVSKSPSPVTFSTSKSSTL